MRTVKPFVATLTALLVPLLAAAEPIPITSDRAVGPLRSDPGDGLCVTLVHVKDPPAPPFTGPKALSDAIDKINLPLGEGMIDSKQSKVFRYARFRNSDSTSVGDFTKENAEAFPFESNFAARVRGYVNVSPVDLIYSNAIYATAGARLRIGGNDIIQFDLNQTVRSVRQLRYSKRGLFPIEMVYYANGGIAVLEASSAPSAEAEGPQSRLDTGRFALIPQVQMFSARQGRAQSCQECSADAVCGKANYCARDWGGGGPGPDGVCQPCLTNDHCGESCGACRGATPVCVQGACAQCAVDDDCALGRACRGGTCVAAPCSKNTDCPTGRTCDLTTRACVATCGNDEDCAVGRVCDPVARQCVRSCQDNNQCLQGEQCDTLAGRCTTGPVRYAGGCSAAPTANPSAPLGLLLLASLIGLGLLRRRSRQGATVAAAAALVFFSLSAGKANAQISANAQTFRPAFGPENVITVEGTRTPRPLRPVLMAFIEYAHRPLYLRSVNGDVLADTVSSMTTLHLMGGLGITRWLSVGVGLPIVLYQGFDRDRTPAADVPDAPAVAGIGDLRLIAKARIINNQNGGFGLAFVPQFTFPTGKGSSFRGEDAFGIEPRFAGDYRFREGSFIAANLGFLGRTSSQVLTGVKVGSQVTYGLGGHLALPRSFGLLLEVRGSTSVQTDSGPRYVPTEAYGGVRWSRPSGLTVMAGAGGGLTEAVGSPEFRLFAGVGYLPSQAKPEARPGVKNVSVIIDKSGGGKGLVTSTPGDIRCGSTCSDDFPPGTEVVLVAEPTADSSFVGWSGPCSGTGPCVVSPREATRVGVEFARKEEPKAILTIEKSGEGTGIVTSEPAGLSCGKICQGTFRIGQEITLQAQADKGYWFSDWGGPCSGSGSCTIVITGPTTVRAEFKQRSKVVIDQKKKRVVLKEAIQFESGKADIKGESHKLLDELNGLLREYDDIVVRIEGHTDNVPFMKPGGNLVLSQDRARAVVTYLTSHGIPQSRLSSEGYGDTCPVATNRTEAGRAMNRRTEFWIINPGDPEVRGCMVNQRGKDEQPKAKATKAAAKAPAKQAK